MNDSQDSGGSSDAKHQAQDSRTQVQQDFLRNAPSIRNFLRALQPSFADAEDLFQELFLLVSNKAAQYAQGTNFLGWVYTIARYQVLASNRKNLRRRDLLHSEAADVLLKDAPENTPDLLDAKIQTLRQCIEVLAPTARTIMDLRYFEGMKPAQIAENLQIDVNRVYLILSRSRALLRKCVEQQLPDKLA